MRYTQSDVQVQNDTSINDGAEIDATGVVLTNTEAGRIIGGVRLLRGGNALINQEGGIVRVANDADPFNAAAVIGSVGADLVINAGLISGAVLLGDGNDRYVKSGGATNSYERVDLGAGDDVYENADDAVFLYADGGPGRDRLSLSVSNQQAVYGNQLTGFEDLVLAGNGQYSGFSGYGSITLGAPRDFGLSLSQSSNAAIDLALAGNTLRLADSSLRTVTGGAAAERLELSGNSTIGGRVDLGGGDDRLVFSRYGGSGSFPAMPGGGASGGAGYDTLEFNAYGGGGTIAVDLTGPSAFEALSLNYNFVLTVTYDVRNASGYSAINLGSQSSLVLRATASPDANLTGGFGGSVTLEEGTTIGRYGFPLNAGFDQRTDIVQGDDRLSVTFANRGSVRGDVLFFVGDDSYDGSAGMVGGTVYGNAGNDVLTGGAGGDGFDGGFGADRLLGNGGSDALNGGAGGDVLTGGSGADVLTGGIGNDVFRDTSTGLNGDTITDLAIGDRINITNVAFSGFTYEFNGPTLSYRFTGTSDPSLAATFGSLTVSNVTAGRITAAAGTQGGVDLLLLPTVRGDASADGRADILWRNTAGQLTASLGNDNGGFSGSPGANSAASLDWQIAGRGDFNGDGRSDILWRNDSGAVTNWLATRSGAFVGNAAANTAMGVEWKVAGTGDFNGDGRDDIAWRHGNGQLTTWLGNANGGFASNPMVIASASIDWRIAGTGDFNGDGRDDILWRNDNGLLTAWLANGSGGFVGNAASNGGASTDWRIAGTGDFNGDGRDDILWRNVNGFLTEWLANPNGGFEGNAAANASATVDWHVAAIGDYNGDGRADVLWRNDSGALTDWLADPSGALQGNGLANAVVGIDWMIIA